MSDVDLPGEPLRRSGTVTRIRVAGGLTIDPPSGRGDVLLTPADDTHEVLDITSDTLDVTPLPNPSIGHVRIETRPFADSWLGLGNTTEYDITVLNSPFTIAPVPWTQHALVGGDLALNADLVHADVLTTGDYVLHLDTRLCQSPDAEGQYGAEWAGSFLAAPWPAFSQDQQNLTIQPNGMVEPHQQIPWTTPPMRLTAGEQIAVAFTVNLDAGSLIVFPNKMQLTIKRTS